jgi:outer membrane protein assembly factor BamB
VLWARAFPRAATALAGGDLLRLTPRGDVELRDVRDGETIWSSRIAPRVGAAALAHAVSATGLPRLVVLAEGERRLVALDLRTGEPRWRYAARHGGVFKMRRVGRLLVVVSGDATLTALDIASGEVVWRYVGTAPFTLTPAVQGDLVIASSGIARRGSTHIAAVDAFSGAARWTADHATTAASALVSASGVAAIALSARDGVKVVGHSLADGSELFATPIGAAQVPGGGLALSAFDDVLVANLPNGRIAAVDAPSGSLRWSKVLAAPVADDTPRRLDVQLRSGALYVPQSSLAVLRPRDGAVLANVDACDLVPDMLRIDEECALFVGEESGHVGCYELGARLGVVRLAPANLV